MSLPPSQPNGTTIIAGLHADITIQRDRYGIAHVHAQNEDDAFFGQGYVAAQDRLWQIEYDRRRALGRWSELAGPSALPADTLSRRLQLLRSAQSDTAALTPKTRNMFEAYCAGVNTYIERLGGQASAASEAFESRARGSGGAQRPPAVDESLPPEYRLTNTTPAPLTPTHSLLIFKIRHILMGPWQKKLAQAQLLSRIGPDAYAKLDGRPPIGSSVILPPDGAVTRTFEVSSQDLQSAIDQLGFLAPTEGGSNSWVLHGSRTTTGKPVLCNDSHRALDVPSVYWQVHLSCPEFDVAGAAFPGLPGFPHFAHNLHVGWNITHTAADYQDLYIERLDDNGNYLTKDGWRPLEQSTERIEIAGSGKPHGAPPQDITLLRTHHGPIVHGPIPDPNNSGHSLAISLRYTATEGPNRAWECLLPMLKARTVQDLFETQREWVDPVNNLVAADTEGNIGYLTRGYLPIRSSQAHRQFPAPGWTGENEWTGRVPHENLPHSINPESGYIATANQQVIPDDTPYISHDFSSPSRADRLHELVRGGPGGGAPGRAEGSEPLTLARGSGAGDLARAEGGGAPRGPVPGQRPPAGGASTTKHTPAAIISWQMDLTSIPARTWSTLLSRLGPYTNNAERARLLLSNFDGHLHPDNPKSLLYSCFRRTLTRALFEPITGQKHWHWITSSDNTSIHAIITRCLATVVASITDQTTGQTLTPNGQPWDIILPQALAAAWSKATKLGGPNPQEWRWGPHHTTNPRHPLTTRFPDRAESWNPPKVPLGGDGDTLCVASFLWRDDAVDGAAGSTENFNVVGLPVYRQAIDFANPETASSIIPGGVSANPDSPHYQDQLPLWAAGSRILMR